ASAGDVEQVASGCYEVLLEWAEAEAEPLPGEGPAAGQARARKAVRLLDLASALAKAHRVPTPQAFHVRRARYLAQAGDEQAARTEHELALQGPPSTALDLFLTALEDYRQGQFSQASAACARVLQQQANHFWAQ